VSTCDPARNQLFDLSNKLIQDKSHPLSLRSVGARGGRVNLGQWRALRKSPTKTKITAITIHKNKTKLEPLQCSPKAGAPSVMHRVTSSLPWILDNLEAEGSGLCPREAEPSPHCVTVAGFSFLPEKARSKLGCQASSLMSQVQWLECPAYFRL